MVPPVKLYVAVIGLSIGTFKLNIIKNVVYSYLIRLSNWAALVISIKIRKFKAILIRVTRYQLII